LAVLLGLVFLAERFDQNKHHTYFWSAIIVIRSAATNIGDIGRDLQFPALAVLALLAGVLALTLIAWKALYRPANQMQSEPSSSSLSAVPIYWWSMLVAGALGTVIGDYFSWGLDFGNLGAALVLGAMLGLLFALGRKGRLSDLGYYWLTVVCIRSAGTAAGDFLAHSVLGLPLSTLVSGIAFIALLGLWRAPSGVGERSLEPV
jgi:uncharacterized membrane-anchored protein